MIGASTNPSRYSFSAVQLLNQNEHDVVPIGIKAGQIDEIDIITDRPEIEDVDTITLYIRPDLQKNYEEYIWSLNPKRIIFNPGTENPVLIKKAKERGIEIEIACTLVMLRLGDY